MIDPPVGVVVGIPARVILPVPPSPSFWRRQNLCQFQTRCREQEVAYPLSVRGVVGAQQMRRMIPLNPGLLPISHQLLVSLQPKSAPGAYVLGLGIAKKGTGKAVSSPPPADPLACTPSSGSSSPPPATDTDFPSSPEVQHRVGQKRNGVWTDDPDIACKRSGDGREG